MKKRNWKFILPPPVLAAFLFMACNLIQEMPKDFVETYGNIAYVESVEYVGLAEEGGDKPKVTETKNFKIIYHIKNDGDFDLSPEFNFEGCEIKNPHVDTGKKRVSLTIAGEELKALDNGKEFKVKLTLYKASQRVLQSSYEIGMLYVDTVGSEISTGTVGMKVEVLDGYTLEEIDGEDKDKFKFVPNGDGSYTITTEEGGVPEGKYELELVVKDKETGEEVIIKKEIEVSTGGFVGDDEPFEITAEMIEKAKKNVVYVRGTGAGWYTEHPDFTALEGNDTTGEGTREKPFATIQKAVDTIIARNADDDSEPYTIYVDGKLTQNEAPSGNKKGMADFSALDKNLNLTIKALSDTTKATLDANKKSRVIYAKPASGKLKLTLENLVITDGNVLDYGGGISFISNGGTLEIKNSEISKNTAPRDGGGVHISGNSTFKMNGCTISENIANGENIGNGAGIYVENGVNATISNTTISGNKAESNGGAIYAANNCNLTTENCTISGNSASGSSVTKGGGVYVTGSTFTMTGGTISGGNAKLGGGVFINSGKFIMNDGTTHEGSITGNTASQNGGGVYVSGGTFEMKGGKISSNKSKVEGKADSNGGGVYVYAGGTFTMSGGNIGGNTATKDGGGVYVTGGTSKFTMTGGKIGDENTANTAQNGGGIYIAVGSTFTMSGGEITGNKAIDGDAEYHGQGGGVYVYSAKFEISGAAKIIGNTAVKSGGGIYIFKDSVTASATLTMTGGTISGNTATNNGGGVYVAGGTLTMSGGTIGGDKNKAENGGGVYVENGIFTMSKGTISNNEAKNVNNNGDGGGVYVKNTKFEMSDTAEISRNNAGYSGGGVYLDGNTFTMNGDAIVDNNTATYGGGVYVSGSTFTLRKGTISNNTARGNGGGVNVYGNKFIMEDGTISGNKAVYRGGGVLLRNSATTFMMNGGEISKNEITDYYNTDNLNGGGGVYVDSGTFTMSNGTISENKINHNGGGNGKGAFISSTFNMSGNAKFNKDDDVYLVNANMIHIAGTLNKDDVAKITPNTYTEDDRQVLSVDAGVTMDETLCNKLFSITPDNGTKWKISYDNSNGKGVLKKDTVSTGGDSGISVTLPDLGTYTFVVKSNGAPIADNDKITSGNDIILEKVTDSKGAEVNGTVTIELQDTSGKILKSNDSNSKTLNVPSYSFDLEAQVYVKVVLKDGNVIEKPIRVTIEPKPNS